MKMYKNILFLTAVIWLILTGNGYATIIPDDLVVDFRDTVWQPANGQASYTVDNVTVTATYSVYDPNLTPYRYYQINQDDKDGLGVRTYRNGDNKQVNEVDEINQGEKLVIKISGGMNLTGVWITDLYDWELGLNENFGEDEYGHLVLNDTTAIDFGAYDNEQYPSNTSGIGTNGELWIDFGGVVDVSSITFFPGSFGENPCLPCNEYSVAGFTAAPVPEPSTILLLGSGLLGLFGVMRKKGNNK